MKIPRQRGGIENAHRRTITALSRAGVGKVSLPSKDVLFPKKAPLSKNVVQLPVAAAIRTGVVLLVLGLVRINLSLAREVVLVLTAGVWVVAASSGIRQ